MRVSFRSVICSNSHYRSLCDGQQDCLGGEDEDNCPTSPTFTGPHAVTNAVMTTKASMNISSTTKMTSLKSESTTNVYTTGSTTTRMTTKMMSPKSKTQTLPTQTTLKLSSPTSEQATSGATVAANTSNGKQFYSYQLHTKAYWSKTYDRQP